MIVSAKRIVVALGGNAITQPHEEGNVEEQFANSRVTARSLADLIEQGHTLTVTHGNGPQIGNFLLRNEAAAGKIYPLPMEVAVAHVQGGMGFMIAESLTNELSSRRLDLRASALITMIEVDRDDPSFADPTKPIGRVLTKEDADRFAGQEGWRVKEITDGKYRRVVPSPKPMRILERDLIRRTVEAGELLVVCGGGGIPVVRHDNGRLVGMPAVIDKDLASALLASDIEANVLMILTNVEQVALDFGKPSQRTVAELTVSEAKQYMAEGQFPAGSMGPKVQGAINFVESGGDGAFAVIGPLDRAAEALAGEVGTRVVPG
ncbi:MAG: carbamate kinase [Phycisphaerae bacterium]